MIRFVILPKNTLIFQCFYCFFIVTGFLGNKKKGGYKPPFCEYLRFI